MVWQYILLMLSMMAVLGVLLWGILTMARGGEYNAKWSNKIMRYHVLLQGIALVIFIVVLLMAGRS